MNDEPEIGATHLIVCREVTWDRTDPEASYTLRGILHSFRPRRGYPAVLDQPLHLYVGFIGEGGEQDVWFELIRFVFDENGEIVDEVEENFFGPFSLTLLPNRFVQGRWYVLRSVPFPMPGLYEFRLRLGGVHETLISARIQLED